VSAGDDTTVKVWETTTGQELLSLAAWQSNGISLCWTDFNPNGCQIATTRFGDRVIQVWEATPLTPELRLRREAAAVVNRLADELLVKEAVREALRRAATLPEPVRREALAMAERLQDDPGRLDAINAASWRLVRWTAPPFGLGVEPHQHALSQVRKICRLAPANGDFHATLGAALYRVGEYQEAIKTLTHAAKLHKAAQKELSPASLAFLAMAHHKLGQKDRAQAQLAQVRSLLKKPEWAANADAQTVLREAEAQLLGEATKPNP
jgi:tetratricopeptide (TPR) repeat protein